MGLQFLPQSRVLHLQLVDPRINHVQSRTAAHLCAAIVLAEGRTHGNDRCFGRKSCIFWCLIDHMLIRRSTNSGISDHSLQHSQSALSRRVISLQFLNLLPHGLQLCIFCFDLLFKCEYFTIFAVDNPYQLVYFPLLSPPLHRSPILQLLLKLGHSGLQLHSRRIQCHVFGSVYLQSLTMNDRPLPQKRVIDQHLLVLFPKLSQFLVAGGAAGAIVHDIITLIAVIIISQMRVITRCLVLAFAIQYYLTLFLAVLLNLAKKTISWLRRQTAATAKIHPFHNAREEVFAWMEEFIKLQGFSLQDYRFPTEDGAEVHLWRIRRESPPPDKPFPIVILHGLLESASTWFLSSNKSQSLPYLLASEGFDVWVGNNRGNRISQTEGSYHNYNIDDLVQFDQPAIIHGVLQVTAKQKIIYVGHSQGSTQLLLALGVHPALKEKIAAFVGMGALVSLSRVTQSKGLDFCAKIYLIELLQLLGFDKLLLISRWMSQAIGVTMYNSAIHLKMVMRGIKHLVGINGKTIPQHMIGVIFTHQPGGGSVNNVLHWIQCFRSKRRFSKFCFGKRKNLQVYGMEIAPEYCLKHLKELPFSSFLFRGEKDALASHEDFAELLAMFDPQKRQSLELKEYNHLDYLWGENAHRDIYRPVVDFALSHCPRD